MPGGEQLSLIAPDEFEPGTSRNHGEVFTRAWVANLILDLAGYAGDADLGSKLIVEPSCGTGGFLVPIVERLLASVGPGRVVDCRDQIRAFDLLRENADRARKELQKLLLDAGVAFDDARALAESWVRVGDFLLDELAISSADFVVGNPPYVRLEEVEAARMQTYRAACATMRGRSDLYVGFIERGLSMLKPGGALAFICADRWMHNQYGAELREFVTRDFAVETVIKMHDVDAFENSVSAYPAITVLRRGVQADVVIADTTRSFGPTSVATFKRWLDKPRSSGHAARDFAAARLPSWPSGRGHWPAGSPQSLALVADLERRFPPLEHSETGTRVGIGVATGADDVFITTDSALVEAARLLPLLRADDIASGEVRWSGEYLVNPWDDDRLVDLTTHPLLAAHFHRHRQVIRSRHVARRRPDAWYRTIDRVTPGLQHQPKLLIPDIKAASHPVLEEGAFYPHHNLYFITSTGWDLEVLGGILLSDVANLFVGTYCVKMRGGCYRFQAQYLRKIRVPRLDDVAPVADDLRSAFRQRDRRRATDILADLYGVDATILPPTG